jgi:hypothetical protein
MTARKERLVRAVPPPVCAAPPLAACCKLPAVRRLPWLQAAGFSLFAVLGLSACAPIEPWVMPYERENLADPIMAFDRHPVSSSYLDHVYEAREGARGGTGGAGGGCGCN